MADRKDFICDLCDYSATRKQGLGQHRKAVHLDLQFECQECYFKTSREYRLSEHQLIEHEGERYSCDEDNCSWTGRSTNGLQDHKTNNHTLQAQKHCLKCDYVTNKSVKHLTSHINTVHNGVTYNCDKCSWKSKSKTDLSTHSCNFSCKKCNFKAQWKLELEEHNITTHVLNITKNLHDPKPALEYEKYENKTFNCSLCKKVYSRLPSLLLHQKSEHMGIKDYKCGKCEQAYPDQSRLNLHLKVHNNPDAFICPYCSWPAASKPWLNKHLGKLHGDELPFKCQYCPLKFPRNRKLELHSKKHIEAKSFKCEHCPMAFFYEKTLKRHSGQHLDQTAFPCQICTVSFGSEEQLKRHGKVHTAKHKIKLILSKTFKCSKCEDTKGYNTQRELDIHDRKHTGEKPCVCSICEKACSTKKVLREHEKTHMEKAFRKTHSCKECGKTYSKSGHLSYHMQVHLGIFKFSCSDCKKQLRSKQSYENHMRTHTGDTPYECKFDGCNVKTKYSSGLRMHIKNIHTKEKSNLCGLCSFAFVTKTSLKNHHKRVHDENAVKNINCPDCNLMFYENADMKAHFRRSHTEVKKVECMYCKKTMASTKSLQTHIHLKHEFAERTHLCNICNRGFKLKTILQAHLKRHERKQTMKKENCDKCDKNFYLKADLQRHKASHTIDRPHKCSLCDQTFKVSKTLQNHLITHEKPTKKCGFCFKTFTQTFDLKYHMKRIHDEIFQFKCRNCSNGFAQSYDRKVHEEKCSLQKTTKPLEHFETAPKDLDAHDRLKSIISNKSHQSISTINDEGNLRFLCDLCTSDFSEPASLKSHKFNIHGVQMKRDRSTTNATAS